MQQEFASLAILLQFHCADFHMTVSCMFHPDTFCEAILLEYFNYESVSFHLSTAKRQCYNG